MLVQTGWDRHWATPAYAEGHPYLEPSGSGATGAIRSSLVGIDSLNIDDIDDGARPVHTLLLGAGIPIVEHLCNLADLPASNFRFHAVPVKFRSIGAFPVRAYAVVDDAEETRSSMPEITGPVRVLLRYEQIAIPPNVYTPVI